MVLRSEMKTDYSKILSLHNNNNFYMAPKFLEMMEESGRITVRNNDVFMGDTDDYFFPPVDDVLNPRIYMDYEGCREYGTKREYDVEYIFDARDLYRMKDGKYQLFKHNINVGSNRIRNIEYKSGSYKDILAIYDEYINYDDLIKFGYSWYEHAEKLDYKILYTEGEPVAFNMWDTSKNYVHYIMTYAIPMSKQSKMYLDDYIQWLFYRDMSFSTHNPQGLLINAGGNFKDPSIKMNQLQKYPVEIRKRWSINYE